MPLRLAKSLLQCTLQPPQLTPRTLFLRASSNLSEGSPLKRGRGRPRKSEHVVQHADAEPAIKRPPARQKKPHIIRIPDIPEPKPRGRQRTRSLPSGRVSFDSLRFVTHCTTDELCEQKLLPSRPPGAFVHFLSEHRKLGPEAGIATKGKGGYLKEMAARWRDMSAEEKQVSYPSYFASFVCLMSW